MFGKEQMHLAGIVIGNIASNAPPLVYCLHCNAVQERSTEIIEFSQYDTPQEILRVLRQTLGTRIVDIFQNANQPCWYYVQLDVRYPTHKIAYWSLPITVYFADWERHHTE